MQLIESFIRSENEKIQVEKQNMKEGGKLKCWAVPKLYDIELIKDNECVDSVNKSDKEGNTNQ